MKLTVFVNVRQALEFQKRVPGSILCEDVVWLRLLDDCELAGVKRQADEGRGSGLRWPVDQIAEPEILSLLNRELGVFPAVLTDLDYGAVDAVVQGASDIVKKVAQPDPEVRVGVWDVSPHEALPLLASFEVVDVVDVVDVTFNELSCLAVDGIQVLAGAL